MTAKTEAAGLPARIAALAILSDVLRKRRPLDAVLDEVLASADLSSRDAGFARAIVGETLRRFGQLDALIKNFVVKPPAPHRVGPVPEILLAGACELLFLDVPPHAAVDAANRLCERDNKAVHFRPLVNAVLRRVASEGKSIVAKQDAARLNTPDWLWARWRETYGEDIAHKIASAHQLPPPLDVVVKDKTQAAEFFSDAENIFGNVFRLRDAGRVDALAGYTEGAWWVQDAAASLPARLLGDVHGQTVIDLCAAPGGKTAQLAAMGANVIAVEREASRMARIAENLARLRLDAKLIESDIRDFTPETSAPFVLLDAPCSATGTIRRHPELGLNKAASDVTACAQSAQELLDAAAEMVAPNGILVFAVCSLEPEEGIEQITSFLESRKDFARVPIGADEVFGMTQLLTAVGDLRTLPYHLPGGMDGFYAARLRKL